MKRKALVVGVNQYRGNIYPPEHSLEDAQAISQLLRTVFQFDEVQEVLNSDRLDIDDLISQLFNPEERDTETALFYFSGNGAGIPGTAVSEDEKGSLLLADLPEPLSASSSNEPASLSQQRIISLKWLHDQLETSPVEQQIVWLDSDYSHLFIDLFSQSTADSKHDRCLIAAKPNMVGFAEESSTHGALTEALLHCLNPVKQFKNSIDNYTLEDLLIKKFNWSPNLIKNIGDPILLPGRNFRAQNLLNDLAEGDDLLSIKSETDALADMLLMRDLTPPLAVAILGGWGSGKSFIMNLMQQRMNEIRSLTLTEEQAWNLEEKKAFPYVGHIYQIKFDAWTFAKSNLWASLMHTIFLELDRQISLEHQLAKIFAEDPNSKVSQAKALCEIGSYWSVLYQAKEEDRDYFLKQVLPRQKIDALETLQAQQESDSILCEQFLWKQYGKIEDIDREQLEQQEKRRGEKESEKVKHEEYLNYITDQIKKNQKEQHDRIEELHADATKEVRQAINSALGISKTILIQRLGEPVFNAIKSQVEAELAQQNINLETLGDMRNSASEIVTKILEKGKVQQIAENGSVKTFNLARQAWWRWADKNRVLISGFVVFSLATVMLPIILAQINNIGAQIAALIVPLVPAIGTGQQLMRTSQKWYGKIVTVLLEYGDLFEVFQQQQQQQAEKVLQGRLQQDLRLKLLSSNAAQLESQKQVLTQSIATLQQEITELDQTISETRQRLPKNVYASLSSFVRSRIEDRSYDKHLGLMNQIKDDLWKLSNSLLPPTNLTELGEKLDQLKQVFPRGQARVVLYIDDLDRCPPDRVVQVLEAVQLLVKTPLFIAVLAIDERYITRALEKHYKDILIRRGSPSGVDYLEKIIQIPYRVRPIASSALSSYLGKQMEVEYPIERDKTASKDISTDRPQPEMDIPKKPGDDKPPVSTPLEPATRLTLDTLKFTQTEFDALLECCQQVELSPRMIKRLVNIYKIFKISEFHASKLGSKTDAQVKAILSVLALSARYPDFIREMFEKLEMEFEQFEMFKQSLKRSKQLAENDPTVQEVTRQKEKELACRERKLKETKIVFPDLSLETDDGYLQGEYRKFNIDAKALLEDVTLAEFDREIFNLVRSFCFFGDIGYSPEDSRRTVHLYQKQAGGLHGADLKTQEG